MINIRQEQIESMLMHDEENIDQVSLREMVTNGLTNTRPLPKVASKMQPWAIDAWTSGVDFNAMIERVPDKAWEEAEKNKNYDAWFPELLE